VDVKDENSIQDVSAKLKGAGASEVLTQPVQSV